MFRAAAALVGLYAAAGFWLAPKIIRAQVVSQLAQRYHLRALSLLPSGDPRRLLAHESLEALYRHLGRRRDLP